MEKKKNGEAESQSTPRLSRAQAGRKARCASLLNVNTKGILTLGASSVPQRPRGEGRAEGRDGRRRK